jgi:hypothetical protein
MKETIRERVRKGPLTMALNAFIVVLILAVAYMSYAFIERTFIRPTVDPERAGDDAAGIIQIDVMNGCGDAGMASKCSSFLRARGFDVVEMRNYKTFDLDHSMVIDRAGDMENAERVARALGVATKNIIQQINQDYYVDVSVVIGKDYPSLRPFD